METGLTTAQAQDLLKKYGPNVIQTHGSFSIVSLFISQFLSVINLILVLAAIFSFILSDIIDGVFILAVIIINALFGFWQEYKAEKSLEKLATYTISDILVRRDGKEKMLPTTELVPGDIVVLNEGNRIPADGIFLTGDSAEIDEAILTGESLPVSKTAKDQLFLGTLLIKGKCIMRVTETGEHTRFGQIAKTLASITSDKTPLQKQLDTVGKIISAVALLIASLIVPIGIYQQKNALDVILVAISIGIAAVPEGLLAVITIALALGTVRMAKQKAIVRQMPAIETLGSVQTILVDKTGTLTQNTMRVKKHWLLAENALPELLKACVLGNTATLIQRSGKDTYEIAGDRTDGALLLFAQEQNPTLHELLNTGKVTDEFVFDTQLRTISTIWKTRDKTQLLVRGAPEMILSKSVMSSKEKTTIEKQIALFANEGYRVIAFGEKYITGSIPSSREKLEQELHFLGIVGIYDPPRPEAKEAIEKAHMAGIHVIMVTGDNELTALSIAKDIGLINKNQTVVTGEELAKLSDEEVLRLLPTTTVFARTQAHDKMRLVTLLQSQGIVVGVTGDGVNDALALKKADVGVAMGESGTDVAKESGDIVLADDNFATLMKAVEEGRTIYHNIVKAITYLLTSNLSEIALVFFSTLLGMPIALLPTQILWINIMTDVIPALALATDNKDHRVLLHQPRNPKTPILTKERVWFMIAIGSSIAWILLVLYSYLLLHFSETFARTVIFNALIFSHLLLALLLRGQSLFKINKLLLVGTIITVLLQLLITTTPFFQRIFHVGW